MTDDDIAKARAKIAEREASPGFTVDGIPVNSGFVLGALDPVFGWSAALDASAAHRKARRDEARVQTELRDALLVQRDDAERKERSALDEVERLRGTTSSAVVGPRVDGAIRLVRDACVTMAEGEAVQLIADEVERLTKLLADKHAQNERLCAEIERLDGDVATLRAEVEWQTKLHVLAERAMRSANEASKGLEALAQAAHDRKEPLEVVADAARAFVAAQEQLVGDDYLAAGEYGDLKRALNGAPVPPEVAELQAAAARAQEVVEDQARQVARILRRFARAVPVDATERGANAIELRDIPDLRRPGDGETIDVAEARDRILALVPDPDAGTVGQ